MRHRFIGVLFTILSLLGVSIVTATPAHADTTLCSGNSFSACTSAGYTAHGYENHYTSSYWNAYSGHNCTNYVGYMLTQNGDSGHGVAMGNGGEWDNTIAAHPEWGYAMNGTPAVGSIAQWDPYAGYTSAAGHVAYVESVSANSITVSEDNYPTGPFRWRVINAGSLDWPSRFLHVKDASASAAGNPAVYMVSPNDQKLYTNYQSTTSGPWSGWQSLGGAWTSTGSITEGRNADGRRQVFLVGGNNELYTAYQTSSGWSGWQSLGGAWSVGGSIAVGNNADGRQQVFLIGQDGKLYSAHQHSPNGSAWSGWYQIGGGGAWSLSTPIAEAVNADGRMEIYLVGGDGKLYTAYQTSPNGGWSGWISLGGDWSTNRQIAVGTNADGRQQVFLVGGGTQHQLYTAYQTSPNGGWSGWQALDGAWSTSSRIVVGNNADGRLQVFLVSPSNKKLYSKHQHSPNGSAWSGWYSLDGEWSTGGSIALTTNMEGEMQVYLVSPSNLALYVNRQTSPNGGWSGWQTLNGAWTAQSQIGVRR